MNIDGIQKDLASVGYCSVSDHSFRKLAPLARAEYFQLMNTVPANAPKAKLAPASLKDSPWKKLAIGSSNGVGEKYAQLLQTTYFAENDARYPALRDIFAGLIGLRNDVLGVQHDFGSQPERDGFWNACRVHHYPRGGGFMSGHKDTHFPAVLGKAGHPFLQVMLLLSERGYRFLHRGRLYRHQAGQTDLLRG